MKTRTGFVSNSSSSSFICNSYSYEGYEPKDLTVDEVVHKMKTIMNAYNIVSDSEIEYDEAIEYIGLGTENVAEMLKGYGQKNYSDGRADWTYDDIKDKIVIMSAGDNTIPSALFDLIVSAFYATRVHLG